MPYTKLQLGISSAGPPHETRATCTSIYAFAGHSLAAVNILNLFISAVRPTAHLAELGTTSNQATLAPNARQIFYVVRSDAQKFCYLQSRHSDSLNNVITN